MWIKYIQKTETNRIGDIVDVGDVEAKNKVELNVAVGVTGPDGLIEEAVIVDEKPTIAVKAKIGKKKKK